VLIEGIVLSHHIKGVVFFRRGMDCVRMVQLCYTNLRTEA